MPQPPIPPEALAAVQLSVNTLLDKLETITKRLEYDVPAAMLFDCHEEKK